MEAQYVLMKKVYEDAGLDPERNITYVEGHMTGTPVSFRFNFLLCTLYSVQYFL